ncbi:sugar/nucleoside kinase (ribokinase family) [Curtobacterium herbarum]|uniref:PfkB family carbohydrate kinase n=1 Tax=Curtobacterium TaxID=2034 RepID=UPI00209D6AAB|nr:MULTISPECIES: PfkB family carbohydrate kinase [Curtobacterium]MCP1503562.1 sugar/nucleoside kinase (ribokinase family) [Curtobacterium herbarum]MDN4646753.1 PfkB family carbohydrate kinase [Curtobacterium sp. PsM8]
MSRLVSVGNVIVDIVMRIGALPEPGGDVIADGSEITAGGGLNTMVAARRDGMDVVFAGQYGTGPFGDVVRQALEESGVTVVQPGLADVDSGYCVALVDATTERTFITSVGAEGQLTRADLDRVELLDDDIVFVSGYGLAHPVNGAAIAGWLGTVPSSVRVVFDPSPLVDTLPAAVLDIVSARSDVVSANSREARLLSPTSATLAEAAAAIAAAARGTALVRDGADGCWVVESGSEPVLVPGFPVAAVDTNGAGDAHDGVLAAALGRGTSLQDAVRRANAAAALAVTRPGPATAPTADETDALLAGA